MNFRWVACAFVACGSAAMLQASEATPANVCGYAFIFSTSVLLSFKYRN